MLLSHRRRRESASALTQQQNEALDDFQKEYSVELKKIAAWIVRQEDAPARPTDDFIRLLRGTFRGPKLPELAGHPRCCQKMVSSLLLRNEC